MTHAHVRPHPLRHPPPALRPPLAKERLHRTREGEICLALRHRWADGTTHLRFDPPELLRADPLKRR